MDEVTITMSDSQLHLSCDLPRLKAAVAEARGNISRAGKVLGITKPWIMALVRRHSLNEWARQLREQSGQGSTGYPKGLPRPKKKIEIPTLPVEMQPSNARNVPIERNQQRA